jgi:hypothetical protein
MKHAPTGIAVEFGARVKPARYVRVPAIHSVVGRLRFG